MTAIGFQAGVREREGVKESTTGLGNTIKYVLRPSGTENSFFFLKVLGKALEIYSSKAGQLPKH
jgi:hypothetical protein